MSTNEKNRGNVAGGLKAALHNERVPEQTKEHLQERLDALNSGASTEQVQSSARTKPTSDANEGNVIGGYKATLANPKVSDSAKQHAREVLEDKDIM